MDVQRVLLYEDLRVMPRCCPETRGPARAVRGLPERSVRNGAFGEPVDMRACHYRRISCGIPLRQFGDELVKPGRSVRQFNRPMRAANSRTSAAYDGLARLTRVVTKARAI